MAAKKLRALVDCDLRQSSDRTSPLFERWHHWPAGVIFEPPKHMDINKALERGIVEEVIHGEG